MPRPATVPRARARRSEPPARAGDRRRRRARRRAGRAVPRAPRRSRARVGGTRTGSAVRTSRAPRRRRGGRRRRPGPGGRGRTRRGRTGAACRRAAESASQLFPYDGGAEAPADAGRSSDPPRSQCSLGGRRLVAAALAAGAPVRDPGGVALRIRADDGAAAAARAAGAAVDVAQRPRPLHSRPHQPGGGVEHGEQLPVRQVVQRPPRRDPRLPQRLRLPEVADARDEPLVEHRVADRPLLRRRAQPLEHRLEVGRVAEDVRAEPSHRAPPTRQLQHRPVPQHRLVLGAAQDEPRPAGTPRATLLHAPAAGHAQVAAQDETALEPQQQVLPHRLDRLEPEPVQPLHQPLPARPRVRRLHLDGWPTRTCRLCAARWSESPSGISESLRLRT